MLSDKMPCARATARVLVVEDDESMRDLVVATLRRDGYDVLDADSAKGATRIIEDMTLFEWSPRAIDLLVSDVWMPGQSGFDLGGKLRLARWSVPMIFMTAFPDDTVSAEAQRLGAMLLVKPFRLDVFRRAVLTAIAAHVRELTS